MKLKKFKERDNKQIGIIIFTITCILLVSGVMLYQTFAIFEVKTSQNVIKGTVQDPGDIYFAYYVDDVIQKDMPQKNEGYILDEEKSYCGELGSKDESIIPTLNEVDWSITVKGMKTSRTKCNLYFRKYYKVKVDEQEYQVQTSSKELTIETSRNILLCNNGITAKEETDGIHLSNITKDSTCKFYGTSAEAINNMNDSKNYILFLNDESIQSTMTIPEEKEVTIDLNGHTKNGTIDNSGTLYLKSSNLSAGKILDEESLITLVDNMSYMEIENMELKTKGHCIWLHDNASSKIINSKINVIYSNTTPTGLTLKKNTDVNLINSAIEAPFGIRIDENGSIIIQNSNVTGTFSNALQNTGNYVNVVVKGSSQMQGNKLGIWLSNGNLTLDILDNQFPIITAEEQAIYLGYGFFDWQYGEANGKFENVIQGAILTRQGTTLKTDNKDGMYHTYLQTVS